MITYNSIFKRFGHGSLRELSLVILLGIISVFPSCTSEDKKAGLLKPNIIYILADDLGYAHLGCYGQEKIETPNIDNLASGGIMFTAHYAGAPVCAPSRCVLLTGKHLGHAQIRANDEWEERGDVWNYLKAQENPGLEGQYPLKEGTQTIASILREAGYETAVIGKWGLGGPLTEGIPNKQGFDHFFGFYCQRQAWNYYPRYLWRDTTKVWLNNELIIPGTAGNKVTIPDGLDPYEESSYQRYVSNEYAPALMQEEAIGFIHTNKEKPFFLLYATPIPHTALQAPQRLIDYYHNKFGDEEPYLGESNYFPVRYPHATFAAMVSYLDEQIGELVNELKLSGIYENTIIIFSSDNGPAFAGGADPPWFDAAKPFNAGLGWGKGHVTEGGIRVPMIVHWPGIIKPESRTGHVTAFYDVLPTVCDIAGAEIPGDTDGISFLPTLLGKLHQKKHQFLIWDYPAGGGQQAVRIGDWKAIRRNTIQDSLQFHLYNLVSDTLEKNDMASEYPQLIRKANMILGQEHIRPENKKFRVVALGD